MADKKKILLVEDDPFLIDLYSARLKKEDFSVLVADDEREGFEKSITEKPDLIILDISLPENEDFELLRKIKNSDKVGKIPVIILSDLELESERIEAKESGADDYFVRSQVAFGDVVETIKNILNKVKRA